MSIQKLIEPFYLNKKWRHDRLWRYLNTKRSESKFLVDFKYMIGKPDQVLVGYGNWGTVHNMKGKDPVPKGRRIRKLLRDAGYKVLLVDEFRTSKRCSNCGGENKKFLDISDRKKNNQKKKDDSLIERSGFFSLNVSMDMIRKCTRRKESEGPMGQSRQKVANKNGKVGCR